MAITRKKKETILTDFAADLKSAKGVVFTEYRGITVKDLSKIRKSLRKENVGFKVIKVTLIKKALEAVGIATSEFKYNGPVAVVYSKDEETTPARAIKNLSKDFPFLVVDGGVLDSKIVSKETVLTLASLPSKDQLLAQLLSVISGPARGLVTVLSGNTRGLLNVLKAMSEKV